ncbi:hypothetical protein WBQ88_13755 [Sphingopyxis sp. CCNWLW253]|uniref:hypothetical protein n=1 Tax=unclassified Sphingopyxis TaxID=2614943 RepID=UPI003012D7A1
MKLYLIAPVIAANIDEAAIDARIQKCIDPIAGLIEHHVSVDPALFAMRNVNEVSDPSIPPDLRYGHVEAIRISDLQMLRQILRDNGDPNSGKWMSIRSLVSCRSVHYGYDGEALVCLSTEDEPIISPSPTTISVEDCSHRLIETSWMDGLVSR